MDQPTGTQNQTPPAPAQPASPPPAQTPPAQKKSNAWIWILGGCLGIAILAMIAMVALGWWGARKAKQELEKYTPDLEEMKKNADEWSKEAEEWEKKSKEFQESLPNPEDMPAPGDYPNQPPIN